MQQSVNIAICEDEAAETKLLCDILDNNDIKNSYTVFTDADSFLASYERDKYDLLLMDIYMKDSMTGIEAISMIRKKDADIPVAFITTSRDHALESYRLSAIGYIEKPVSAAELNNVLHLAMLKKADAPSLYIKRNGALNGIGKPEKLKNRPEYSRRIDDANRLVYVIDELQNIKIIACRGHYDE